MSYFLEGYKTQQQRQDFVDYVDNSFRTFVCSCLKGPANVMLLGQPGAAKTSSPRLSLTETAFDLRNMEFACVPPTLCAFSIARKYVLEYEEHLRLVCPDILAEFTAQMPVPSLEDHSKSSPKMVLLGLECLFKLLSDLTERDPDLCASALSSLCQILEALTPGELASESKLLTAKLFEMLEGLFQTCATEEVSNLAGTCMLALAVAGGSTELLIQTAAALVCGISLPVSSIPVPENFRLFYRVLMHRMNGGSASMPDWFHRIVSRACITFQFQYDQPSFSCGELPPVVSTSGLCSMAVDGKHIYLLDERGLVKIGSGCSESRKGTVYATSGMFRATSDINLFTCRGSLYLKRKHSSKVFVLDSDSLLNTGEILLPTSLGEGTVCSDGINFLFVSFDEQQRLVITTMDDSFCPAGPGLQAQMTSLRLLCAGEQSDLELGHLLSALKPARKSGMLDLRIGKDVALLLTRQGKVFYAGKGTNFLMADSEDEWTELPLTESALQIAIGHNGTHFVVITKSGQALFFGVSQRGEDGDIQQLRRTPQLLKGKRMPTAANKRIVAAACNAGSTALVSEDGKLFVFGKDSAGASASGGMVTGLQHEDVVKVALGKAHVVALTRRGTIYTFGMNNFGQCGRSEILMVRDSDSERSSRTDEDTSSARSGDAPVARTCKEHDFRYGAPMLCSACKKCTAHGSQCLLHWSPELRKRKTFLSCGDGDAGCAKCGVCRACAAQAGTAATSSDSRMLVQRDSDSESKAIVLLSPAKVMLRAPTSPQVRSVACGNYHSMFLTTDSQVMLCGSNRFGQLGQGDCRAHTGPQSLVLPSSAAQISAGSNHCVVRTEDGLVYTFGRHHNGQLCRDGKGQTWFASPGLVDGFDAVSKKHAVWVGACADTTIIHYEHRLVTKTMLNQCYATANERYVVLFSRRKASFQYLIIDRSNGHTNVFRDCDIDFSQLTFALDPLFNLLWSWDPRTMTICCFDPARKSYSLPIPRLQFVYNAHYWLPTLKECSASNVQLGMLSLNLLCMSIWAATKSTRQQPGDPSHEHTPDEYSVVDRFQGFGGGWGYSAQTAEAIQFNASRNILLCGVGLLGGRGEYWTKIKLLRVRGEDTDERSMEVLTELDDVTFECGARERCHIFFRQPVHCAAHQQYVVWVAINGPSSDCGSNGKATVVGDDGTTFNFRNSKLSNNGTDVMVGQIPQLLYRIAEPDVGTPGTPCEESPFTKESGLLLATGICSAAGSPACIVSCLKLLSYCVERTLHLSLGGPNADWEIERLCSISILTTNALKVLLLHAYPAHSGPVEESKEIAVLVEECFQLITGILSCSSGRSMQPGAELLLEECALMMVSCFHIFFPTLPLFKFQLLDMLRRVDQEQPTWLLYALLMALNENVQPLAFLLGHNSAPTVKNSSLLVSTLQTARYTKMGGPQSIDLEVFMGKLLSFAFDEFEESGSLCERLALAASDLCVKIIHEFVLLGSWPLTRDTQSLLQTPSRFAKKSSTQCWDTSNGTADAICFRVDVPWIVIHGAGIYVGTGSYTYNLELLVNQGSNGSEHWQVLEKATGILSSADGFGDIGFVRFPKPIRISEGTSYSLRLFLHGSKTWCGESGYQSVTAARGSKFIFQACSQSRNGTSVSRGQIPVVLYSAEVAQACSQLTCDEAGKWLMFTLREYLQRLQTVCSRYGRKGMVTVQAKHATEFQKRVFGLLALFVEKNPQSALSILKTIDEPLSSCAAFNIPKSPTAQSQDPLYHVNVESDHPYRPSNVQSFTVTFPAKVSYVALEFDELCSTSQPEDSLELYVSSTDGAFTAVAKFTGKSWPKHSILMPGNRLLFLLDSSPNFHKADAAAMYGFRCMVTGLATSHTEQTNFLQETENELALLVTKCCHALLTESHKLGVCSSFIDLPVIEEEGREMMKNHGNLLRKGFHFAHVPNILEIGKSRKFPDLLVSPEKAFATNFISAVADTTAGRLARWLMPEPYVDPNACEFLLECDHFQSGQPALITVITKDQYGRIAHVPHMNVDVIVVVQLGDMYAESEDRTNRLPLKSTILKTTYQPTYLNRARYVSVTLMKPFERYSLEELRLAFMSDSAMKESLMVTSNQDGTYLCRWVPKQSGDYRIDCLVDDFLLTKFHIVNIHNGKIVSKPQTKKLHHSRARMASCKHGMTQGVRIRAAPSLSAEQVGMVPRGNVIFYVDETENNDGIWLKLSDDSALNYCGSIANPTTTWCMQYNRYLNRVVLLRESDTDNAGPFNSFVQSSTAHSVVVACEELYAVIKCGYAGVEIKAQPYRAARVVGSASLSEEIKSIGWLQNRDGVWIQLHKSSLDRYAFEAETHDGFCMVQEINNGSAYLDRVITPEASGTYLRGVDNAVVIEAQYSDPESPELEGDDDSGMRQIGTQTSPVKERMVRVPAQNRQKAVVRLLPQNAKRKSNVVQAIRPSFVHCARSVFAAFLWHEQAIHDAMACAAYLKFYPELQCLQYKVPDSQLDTSFDSAHVPLSLQLIHLLWKEISTAVKAAVQQHLILPSPPMALRSTLSKDEQRPRNSTFCELCDGWFPPPVTAHMRIAHPGCGSTSEGHGYGSIGKYILSGYNGNCGDADVKSASWYLLCRNCREKYMHTTTSFKERAKKHKGRFFRNLSGSLDPQKIIKNNAMFLLELNMRDDALTNKTALVDNSSWNINLFPTLSPERAAPAALLGGAFQKAKSDYLRIPHHSDPGPQPPRTERSRLPCSDPCSSDMSIGGREPSEQEVESLISSPSTALRQAVVVDQVSFSSTLKRPVLSFVIQHHDLTRIKEAMQLAVVRAASFSHVFQVLRWLLRLVNNQRSVESILWHFILAMDTNPQTSFLTHPLRMTMLAGPLNGQMMHNFHRFLSTVAQMLNGEQPLALQLHRLCLRTWSVEMTVYDHQLIVDCQLLPILNHIMADNGPSAMRNLGVTMVGIDQLKDVTNAMRVEVSSRKDMAQHLINGKLETFWESGDEDRTRHKWITLKCISEHALPKLLAIYLDCERDHMARVHQIIFHMVANGTRRKLVNKFVDSTFVGWLKCVASPEMAIELKGQEHVRVRQVMVLGTTPEAGRSVKPSPSSVLQFSALQNDAFKLFQNVVTYAFGDTFVLSEESSLRQQLLDIVFSRDQFGALQSHVIAHVLTALEKEITLLKDLRKQNYTFCSGLLSLLRHVCNYSTNRDFGANPAFVIVMAELMCFSPSTIQSQLLKLFTQLLGNINPSQIDHQRFITQLLMIVAKALNVQIRLKAKRPSVTTTTAANALIDGAQEWFFRRPVKEDVAQKVADLVSSLASGTYGHHWATCTRNTIAQHILSPVLYPSERRDLRGITNLQSFWLCISALCCLKDDEWLCHSPAWKTVASNDRASAANFCDNHDDGETVAHVWCGDCKMNLCMECSNIFHLSKRRKDHVTKPLSFVANDVQVDLHEGCHRLRLTWLLVLVDCNTMNGMVELREDLSKDRPGMCRFCGEPTGSDFLNVCNLETCQAFSTNACFKLLQCGHFCGGILREEKCLPCLRCRIDPTLRQDADDMCMICFTDTISSAPAIQLVCGHVFHYHCVCESLRKRWPGPRITFAFLQCPICKTDIRHPSLETALMPLRDLLDDVSRKAMMRLEFDGLAQCTQISAPDSPFYQNPTAFALDRYAYYICCKCQRAYFGGEAQCEAAVSNTDYDPLELVCGACSDVAQAQICSKHGSDYLEYKCRYCCSIAVFFCFGTTHFCAPCHDDFQRITQMPKHALPKCPTGPRCVQLEGTSCPLKMEHPPTGEEFALGCGVCRNVESF